jgi:hypothetical protein
MGGIDAAIDKGFLLRSGAFTRISILRDAGSRGREARRILQRAGNVVGGQLASSRNARRRSQRAGCNQAAVQPRRSPRPSPHRCDPPTRRGRGPPGAGRRASSGAAAACLRELGKTGPDTGGYGLAGSYRFPGIKWQGQPPLHLGLEENPFLLPRRPGARQLARDGRTDCWILSAFHQLTREAEGGVGEADTLLAHAYIAFPPGVPLGYRSEPCAGLQ